MSRREGTDWGGVKLNVSTPYSDDEDSEEELNGSTLWDKVSCSPMFFHVTGI